MSYADVDRTLGPVLDIHAAEVNEYSDLLATLKAADGDRKAALENYISTSEDTDVVKLRNAIEAANAKLQALAEKNVQDVKLSEDERAKLNTQAEQMKTRLRNGRKAILSIMETMKANVDQDAVKAALEKIGDPTSGGRGRKVGSTGSSLPKASAVLTVSNGKDSWTFDTFGLAAKHMSLPVEDLQKAYAAAAKVEHSEIASVDKPQTFTLSTSNGTWSVATKPKPRKKPGPRPGGNAAAAPKAA